MRAGSNYSPFIPVRNVVVIDLKRPIGIRRFRAREKKDGSFNTETTDMIMVEIRRKEQNRFMEHVGYYLRPGT